MPDDNQYLLTLQDYYASHRVLPSYAAIGKLVGLASKASVAGMVLRLKSEGFLESTPDRRLKPGRRFFERTLAESVRAGQPTAAPDTASDTLSIDEYLVPRPSKTTLVTVRGDSMLDAGIHSGDVVIVERKTAANVGDIVIAIVDNEFTLKYLAQDKRGLYLRAANPAYPPIRAQGQLEIFGVVTGSFRKYK